MERIKITRMKEIWKNAGFIIHGMKGCCGHITNFSVVSGFAILIFCFFTYFLVCLFPKNVFDAYTCLHVNSSKKIFNFISQTIFTKLCMLFLIVCKKKCLPLWTRPLQTMSFLFNPLYQGNRRHSWSWVWVLFLGNGKYKYA